jgi:hypothetical protein
MYIEGPFARRGLIRALGVTTQSADLSIEDCAVEYARYWFARESAMVQGLSAVNRNDRLAALQKAAGYFRVARNLPKAYDVDRGLKRLAPALELLEALPIEHLNRTSLSKVIESFRYQLAAAYGGIDRLSAATKFLWLLSRDVVVIFDSQARNALGTSYGDYDGYLKRWYQGYATQEEAIAQSCSRLVVRRKTMTFGEGVSDVQLSDLAAEDWFRRRVYDVYLWRRGAPSGPHP